MVPCVHVDAMSKVADIEAAEKTKMKNKVGQIIECGINCFVNCQFIYNYPEELILETFIPMVRVGFGHVDLPSKVAEVF